MQAVAKWMKLYQVEVGLCKLNLRDYSELESSKDSLLPYPVDLYYRLNYRTHSHCCTQAVHKAQEDQIIITEMYWRFH